MSGLMDQITNAAESKLGQDSQPGDGVERQADNSVNQEIDQAANDVGVPQQDDQFLNEAVDSKVNSDIPFGNN